MRGSKIYVVLTSTVIHFGAWIGHLYASESLKMQELPGAPPPGPPAGTLPLHPAGARKVRPHRRDKSRLHVAAASPRCNCEIALESNALISS